MIKVENETCSTEGTLREMACEAALMLLHVYETMRRELGEHDADKLLELIVDDARDQEYRDLVREEFDKAGL